MGISYKNNNKTLDYRRYNAAIKNFLKCHKSKIIFEPGRSIIGNTGYLISQIIYIKKMIIKYKKLKWLKKLTLFFWFVVYWPLVVKKETLNIKWIKIISLHSAFNEIYK